MRKREEVLDELVKWIDMLASYKKHNTESMFRHCEERIHFLRWVLGKEQGL